MDLLEAFDILNEGARHEQKVNELEQKITENETRIKNVETQKIRAELEAKNLSEATQELRNKQSEALAAKDTLVEEAYDKLLGHSVFVKNIVRRKEVENEIVLTSENLILNNHEISVKIVNSEDSITYLPIDSAKLIIKDADLNNIVESIKNQRNIINQLKDELEAQINTEKEAYNKVRNLNGTVISCKHNIEVLKKELDAEIKAEEIRIEKRNKKWLKNRSAALIDLENTSDYVQDKLEVSPNFNIWTAIGWLAKHATMVRIKGPKKYYKDYYEKKFDGDYIDNGHSSENDWPGGTLACDKPFWDNDSVYYFVTEAIKEANNHKSSSMIHDTNPITRSSRSTNCLALVYMLLDKYGFRMGKKRQKEEDVKRIAPIDEYDLEMFKKGYNS